MIMRRLVLFVVIVSCAISGFAQAGKDNKSFVLGSIVEIPSSILSERRSLNIYFPEGYNSDDTVRYPVIYLLDGGADEDFIHVTGLVQFYNFEWINRVPKSILVGICNTDRKRDFTFPSSVKEETAQYKTTGGSERFISFIEKELQPYIDKKYKTSSSRMLIGQSLGGLLATEILFKKPELFDKYLIISPSLWWSNGSLLDLKPERAKKQTDVYVAVGKEGLTPGKNPRVMEVDANLLVDKLEGLKNDQLKVYFDYLPDEDHATIGHQAVMNGFKMLYPKVKRD